MQLDAITREFVEAHRDDCACVPIKWWQIAWYAALFGFLVRAFLFDWLVTLCIVNFIVAFWYFSVIVFRATLVCVSACGFGQVRIRPSQVEALVDADLPIYTILVPLYKEANIAGKIVKNMAALDYPMDKLDIKLLLEPDDHETVDTVRKLDLPSCYDVIVVPESEPKTKPKACNHGLVRAKGEFSVIYDAEDRPEHDQLKKAVCAFRQADEKVACIQAKLNYYNAEQNLLTRWFTIEYSTTFDLYLPGLQLANIPVPLGGTSNHFRTAVLKEIGGWDPFNVTEDCDLGVRIYRTGFRTQLLDSTTWEEANSQLWNWIRQRSRWVKGFFQTHLTHMRNPFRTVKQLGLWGTFGFLLSVGGSSVMMLLNVVYWLVMGIYGTLLIKALSAGYTLTEVLVGPRLLRAQGVWPMIYMGEGQDPVWVGLSVTFFVVACILLLANLLFVFMHCLACIRRKQYRLLPFALLMPIYWVLISIGAWKGFLQLLTRPFYWEKTIHGLDGDGES